MSFKMSIPSTTQLAQSIRLHRDVHLDNLLPGFHSNIGLQSGTLEYVNSSPNIAASALADGGANTVQRRVEVLIRVPYTGAALLANRSSDLNDDIIVFNANSPSLTITDIHVHAVTATVGAATIIARSLANGLGTAISSAIATNGANALVKTTTLTGNVLTPGSSLFLNFDAPPTAGVGAVFIRGYLLSQL